MRSSSLKIGDFFLLLLIFSIFNGTTATLEKYTADWSSLDSRPNPTWYDEAKVGVMLHWGVYSVPSFGSEWFWIRLKNNKSDHINFMKKNFRPGYTYQEFAKDFTAENFVPNEWAALFEESGAKYVVMTTKHHDGYTLWPSKYSFGWNSMDVGPHRDLVGELGEAIKKRSKLVWGLYYSLFEWFNPMYLTDKENNYTTRNFVDQKMMPELKELVMRYKPEYLFSDGDWMIADVYWKSTEFLAWLFNESPVRETVVVNDRWGKGTRNRHGGVWTAKDHYNPGTLQKHKFENAMTVDIASWGYRSDAALRAYTSGENIIRELVSTVSIGGNFLLNVGPSKNGIIPPILEDRLRQMGRFLRVNGEAIYASHPWTYQTDSYHKKDVWYTMKKNPDRVFAILLKYPDTPDRKVLLKAPMDVVTIDTKVSLLGHKGDLKIEFEDDGVSVELPPANICYKLSDLAWTLKFEV